MPKRKNGFDTRLGNLHTHAAKNEPKMFGESVLGASKGVTGDRVGHVEHEPELHISFPVADNTPVTVPYSEINKRLFLSLMRVVGAIEPSTLSISEGLLSSTK